MDHVKQSREKLTEEDPMEVPVRLSAGWKAQRSAELPPAFNGGWVGFTSYDTVRYVYGSKLPFAAAPPDDRQLPDPRQ